MAFVMPRSPLIQPCSSSRFHRALRHSRRRYFAAGSSFDTILGVYTGDAVSALTTIAGDDDAVISLATLRDAGGQPSDFQVVHHNKSAAMLLKAAGAGLLWRRIGEGGKAFAKRPVADLIVRLQEVDERRRGQMRGRFAAGRAAPVSGRLALIAESLGERARDGVDAGFGFLKGGK